MNDYSEHKSLNHGFHDKEEAKKFESLMTKYHVNIVFSSHIHSYFSFIKNNVRYIITGGAGAELLTKNSYYHYLRIKVTNDDTYIENIEVPSPNNTLEDIYIAAIQLFANAIYKEYKSTILFIVFIILLILGWLLYSTYTTWKRYVIFVKAWLTEIFKFSVEKFKDLKKEYLK